MSQNDTTYVSKRDFLCLKMITLNNIILIIKF
nr:MAG TPA_asm: hypothetical protein [Caudoviricetes sp.]